MRDNRLRQIKLVIYALKRAFGAKIQVYRVTSETHNVRTGVIDRIYSKQTIRRAVVLPNNITRDFVYDLSFIAANKNFTYGGLFDPEQRNMILDAKDVSNGFVPNNNDYVIYNNERWLVAKVVPTAEVKAFFMTIKRTTSLPNDLVLDVETDVSITQEAEGTV